MHAPHCTELANAPHRADEAPTTVTDASVMEPESSNEQIVTTELPPLRMHVTGVTGATGDADQLTGCPPADNAYHGVSCCAPCVYSRITSAGLRSAARAVAAATRAAKCGVVGAPTAHTAASRALVTWAYACQRPSNVFCAEWSSATLLHIRCCPLTYLQQR